VRACLTGVATVLLIAACAADVVRVDGAPSALAPTTWNEAATVCGLAGPVAVPGALLSAADVWPDASDTGGVTSEMPLDGVACRHDVTTTPAQPADCDLGFPFYAPGSLPAELARLGVTQVREANLLRVRADGSASARLTELVLTLDGPAAAGLEAAAVGCDAEQTADEQPPLYTIRDSRGDITVAARIGYDTAVGLTFVGGGLNNATKLALLDRAVNLAGTAASG
jgi:hypothetical protein